MVIKIVHRTPVDRKKQFWLNNGSFSLFYYHFNVHTDGIRMADSVSLFDKKWVLVNKNFVQSRVGPMIVERL